MKALLIISSDSIQGLNTLTSNNFINSIWFWISISEFIIIFLILNRYVFNKSKLKYSNLSKVMLLIVLINQRNYTKKWLANITLTDSLKMIKN